MAAVKKSGEKFGVEWQIQQNPSYDSKALADEVFRRLKPALQEEVKDILEKNKTKGTGKP